MSARARQAIEYAVEGFGMEMEDAILLLQNSEDDNLTKEDIDRRDRLVAAVNNLVEFSVCAEYHLYKEILSHRPDIYEEGVDLDDEDEMTFYNDTCAKYNGRAAAVENGDIKYAMGVAAWWIHISGDAYLTYMTQNDDRVRPWHYALQGFTARRDDFPSWMIPPIEWACRCFLITDSGDTFGDIVGGSDGVKEVVGGGFPYGEAYGTGAVRAAVDVPEKPVELDGVFVESVAKCGRIFSKAHPYFDVDEEDVDKLNEYVDAIKKEYYG